MNLGQNGCVRFTTPLMRPVHLVVSRWRCKALLGPRLRGGSCAILGTGRGAGLKRRNWMMRKIFCRFALSSVVGVARLLATFAASGQHVPQSIQRPPGAQSFGHVVASGDPL